MTKKCIYYSMFIENIDNLRYYCMAYNAMRSLQKVYDSSFDIIIFYHLPIDIDQFNLNDHFNIKKDFPFVKFIQSNYASKYRLNRVRPYKHDAYMSKWYHLQECLKLGYDQILFLDCDTVFIKDPSYLFTKYLHGHLWSLSCSDPVHNMLYPLMRNMNSGQFMIHSQDILDIDNLYNNIVEKRSLLSTLARSELYNKKLITDQELAGYDYFNEQYCGQMLLLDNPKLSYKEFDDFEIIHPAAPVEFYCDNQLVENNNNKHYSINLQYDGKTLISDIKDNTYIIHYSSGKSVCWVDKELRNQDLINGYNAMYTSLMLKIQDVGV